MENSSSKTSFYLPQLTRRRRRPGGDDADRHGSLVTDTHVRARAELAEHRHALCATVRRAVASRASAAPFAEGVDP